MALQLQSHLVGGLNTFRLIFIWTEAIFGVSLFLICSYKVKTKRPLLLDLPKPNSLRVRRANLLCSDHSFPWLNTIPGILPEK